MINTKIYNVIHKTFDAIKGMQIYQVFCTICPLKFPKYVYHKFD